MMPPIDFQRNNLDRAMSPYLRQHKENPIHWQEWNQETLDYAREQGKLLFVSIGYATCHWCHVMAEDSFSDEEVAGILNEHFVSIKVDREQRPDLDQYFIAYVTEKTGSAGWPLNVILSPTGTPLFGGTYFPPTARLGQPSFKDVLHQTIQWYHKHGEAVEGFTMPRKEEARLAEDEMVTFIHRAFDTTWGGFGSGTKFPPHSTLFFLMTFLEEKQSDDAAVMIRKTLDGMAQRGLHDHLQGGFFRYATDREWTIPHFEKMLYDQAMLLFNYSLAFKLFGEELYKTVTDKLLQCLEETFEENGLYHSAHDADTNHKEGAPYLWTYEELKDLLSAKEFEAFSRVYDISKDGNFEGKNHLIKKSSAFLPEVEKRLLSVRKKRAQPFTDRKIVTSWNALLGSALLMHARAMGEVRSREKAIELFEKLLGHHYHEGKLMHSSLGESVQKQGFLEDYASMLLFATFLYEETWEESYTKIIGTLLKSMESFEDDDGWHENEAGGDFRRIAANVFDHPTPSSVALAAFARYRAHRILGIDGQTELQFRQPLESDFYNAVVFLMQGHCHEISAPEKIEWNVLPVNSMQLPGKAYRDCYHRQCQKFSRREGLLTELRT